MKGFKMKKRVFNICQFFQNPRTGETLITDEGFEQIKTVLNKYKTLKKWAWIIHEDDVYTEEDEDNNVNRLTKEYHNLHKKEAMTEEYSLGLEEYIKANKWVYAGKPKPKHIHIVISTGTAAVDPVLISRWLGLPMNVIDYPYGTGAFLDCVEYLTHESEAEQAKGKHLYSDDCVVANFDWRAELTEKEKDRIRYGGYNLSTRDKFRYEVLYNGMTLKECAKLNRINYMEDIDRLRKYRIEYIRTQQPPVTRINYYICGRGGLGKGLMSRAIARALFPNLKDDEDIFFIVGAGNSTFEGYDGQPVIIWDDFRASELLKTLGGRGNVFNVFDTHPTKQRQNVKFGSINLCNVVNIVNSVEPYLNFLNELAGEYVLPNGERLTAEDKGQAFRRFPLIIPLHEEDFDLLLNKGFLDNTAEFEEFYEYKHIRGNLQKVRVACGNNEEIARKIEMQTVKPIAEKHKEVLESSIKEVNEEDVLKQFQSNGTIQEQPEAPEPSKDEFGFPYEDWLPF